MIYRERLLKILRYPHVSEKTSFFSKKFNTISFKVPKYANKSDIQAAVNMVFSVKVNRVNIVVVKNKVKSSSRKKITKRSSSWKKAYVILEKGQSIDLLNNKV